MQNDIIIQLDSPLVSLELSLWLMNVYEIKSPSGNRMILPFGEWWSSLGGIQETSLNGRVACSHVSVILRKRLFLDLGWPRRRDILSLSVFPCDVWRAPWCAVWPVAVGVHCARFRLISVHSSTFFHVYIEEKKITNNAPLLLLHSWTVLILEIIACEGFLQENIQIFLWKYPKVSLKIRKIKNGSALGYLLRGFVILVCFSFLQGFFFFLIDLFFRVVLQKKWVEIQSSMKLLMRLPLPKPGFPLSVLSPCGPFNTIEPVLTWWLKPVVYFRANASHHLLPFPWVAGTAYLKWSLLLREGML